ncbi:hypothetical protein BX666DRAFT_1939973 [Dichotomocladium elegans]|nr:hypothetical protein BX666DRAFT_1939973 [Dichotomocladium elegans]
MAKRVRRLGPLEKVHLKNHLNRQYGCITGLAHLYHSEIPQDMDRSDFFRKHVHAALARVIKNSPILSVTVADAEKDPWFVKLISVPLDQIVHLDPANANPEAAFYRCTNQYFDLSSTDRPPWSVHIADNMENGLVGILLSLPHFLGDPHTVKLLLQAIVENIRESDTNSYLFRETLPSALPLPPVYEDTKGNLARLPLLKRFAHWLVGYSRTNEDAENLWRPVGNVFKETTDDQAGVHVKTFQLYGYMGDWNTVVDAAKKHDVSGRAAFHTALLLAMRESFGVGGKGLATRTSIDLRPLSSGIDNGYLGNATGIFAQIWDAESCEMNFWTLAAKYQAELDAASHGSAGTELYTPVFNLGRYPWDYTEKWARSLQEAKQEKQPLYSGFVDLGDFVTRKGDWKTGNVLISQSTLLYNKLISVTTINTPERLGITLGWQQYMFQDDAVIDNLFRAVIDRLRKAVQEDQ